MFKQITPYNCSQQDLIYYLITYKFRYPNIPKSIVDKQTKYVIQLISKRV